MSNLNKMALLRHFSLRGYLWLNPLYIWCNNKYNNGHYTNENNNKIIIILLFILLLPFTFSVMYNIWLEAFEISYNLGVETIASQNNIHKLPDSYNRFYTIQSVAENGYNPPISKDDLEVIFQQISIVKQVAIYLLYTSLMFLIMILLTTDMFKKFNILTMIKNSRFVKNNNLLKKMSFLKRIPNLIGGSNITFLYVVLPFLIVIQAFYIHMSYWFIKYFDIICKSYLYYENINRPECSNLFMNINAIDYFSNEILLCVINILMLLILLYLITSSLIHSNSINIEFIKDKPFIGYIYPMLMSLTSGSKLYIVLMFIIILFLFTTFAYSAYNWYWFVNDFYYIASQYLESLE